MRQAQPPLCCLIGDEVRRTSLHMSSFHSMIPSFHAVFGLRQRDKTAKVIDYNDQVIRVRDSPKGNFSRKYPLSFST